MADYVLGPKHAQETIQLALATYRQHPDQLLKEQHPFLSFVTLKTLAYDARYASVIDQSLLCIALDLLTFRFARWTNLALLDPERVWIGIASPPESHFFGGFHHADQGYRYLQQLSITCLAGCLSPHPVDQSLRTLELLRAFVHDTLHHHTYRLFCPYPERTPNPRDFYRLQYGINFRRWDGQSYSAKDSVRSRTTRNLGTLMEAATDRFAQEWVFFLAEGMGYRPEKDTVEYYLYKECTGQLREQDIITLRDIEQGRSEGDLPESIKAYLKSMRLFAQYVTMRYRAFLASYTLEQREEVQNHILQGMLSGKFRALCHLLDTLEGSPRGFVTLFKTAAYSAQKMT